MSSRASRNMAGRSGAGLRAAFTLIELLVVIIIIAIIISIVLPALGGARKAARTVGTKQLLTTISNAASSFQNDNRKLPGYFTQREMGHTENADRGFSNMQNVMLDLAGAPAGTVAVGPTATATVSIEPDQIGVPVQSGNNKQYWLPERKYFAVQNITGQQNALPEHQGLPSVIDTFGNPILAWVKDDTAVGQITTVAQFAAEASPTGNGQPSRFYWNSNAAFLKATNFGKQATSQINDSMLGVTGAAQRAQTLAGILGNPSFPARDSAGNIITSPAAVATTPRAPFVVHSAGADSLFVGKKDRGAKQFPSPTGPIDYLVNFFPPGSTTAYTDKDGKRTSIDIMNQFDDVMAYGGN